MTDHLDPEPTADNDELNLGPKATWHDRMSAAQGLQR